MINEIRTLLRNRAPSSGGYGAVYVPENYAPLPFFQEIEDVRKAFGLVEELDESTMNYALRNILNVVHQPDFSGYLENFDPRTTYDPASPLWFARFMYNPRWSFSYSSSTSPSNLTAEALLKSEGGEMDSQIIKTIRLSYIDASHFNVERNGTSSAKTVVMDSSGIGNWVELEPDILSVRFRSPSGSLPGPFLFTLSAAWNFRYDIAKKLELLDQQEPHLRKWAGQLGLDSLLKLYFNGLTATEKFGAAAILLAAKIKNEHANP